jgi:hypothetical protein
LVFEDQSFQRKTTLPGTENCPEIKVKIPVANGVSIVLDSINKKVFSVLKQIIYFGEKPYTSKDYNGLLKSFIDSYEQLQKKFPQDKLGWQGDINRSVTYQSENLLNIKIDHYTYSSGAHGYRGLRSLLFNPETGTSISANQLFKEQALLKAFAEKKFREKYKIPANKEINSGGLMFENEKFQLPQNIFITDKGLLLYYNIYGITSYADGATEMLLPYTEVNEFLYLK